MGLEQEDEGMLWVFVICVSAGLLFVGLGIGCLKSKKAVGFWSMTDSPKVKNVKKYNRAVGVLWIEYGLVFVFLSTSLFGGQNSMGIVIFILGCMFESIMAMVVYTVYIEPRYGRK